MRRFPGVRQGLAVTAVMLVAASAMAAGQDGIQWHSDPAKAHQLARRQNRPLLLLVTMESCHYCTKIKQSTYMDGNVAATVADGFVASRIDAKNHKALVEQLKIEVYPTTVIISPDYQVLDVIRGYVDPVRLRQRMAAAAHRDRIARLETASPPGGASRN
jgi:thioredoxin-related protein